MRCSIVSVFIADWGNVSRVESDINKAIVVNKTAIQVSVARVQIFVFYRKIGISHQNYDFVKQRACYENCLY
ncbi:MAG: hypothetical protein IPK03_17545 [Bacteroidetes bacterium]|nr:hypothetical protein [Bacteroidota bacterium]